MIPWMPGVDQKQYDLLRALKDYDGTWVFPRLTH